MASPATMRLLWTPPFLGHFDYEVREFHSLREAWCLDGTAAEGADCASAQAMVTYAAWVAASAMAWTLLRPPMLPPGVHKTKSWHLVSHNNVNLVVLPLMTSLATLGVFGMIPNDVVCYALAGYMAFDFLWIAIFPRAVASKPKLILVHHCVTFFLGVASAHIGSGFGYMCSYATCVELNTFLLVAMRLPSVRGTALGKLLEGGFWVTCLVFRMGVHPWLVYHSLFAAPAVYPPHRILVTLGMTFMVLFNMYYVYLRVKKDAKADAKASKAKAKAKSEFKSS
uniref:TLC domain-containing protein n=1 Tax=Pinguiococcus pyrenoidosus TaxID=172671 RepID=A0A7R9YEM5_9STRA|mmetsp:Transcript_6278/g.24467  ORF Transcript_6278/g.24467 Transcript_6278/m.24467 type:complete len:282 (+) Transcript_6278:26-871(+)